MTSLGEAYAALALKMSKQRTPVHDGSRGVTQGSPSPAKPMTALNDTSPTNRSVKRKSPRPSPNRSVDIPPLFEAVVSGDVDAVRDMLLDGVDVKQTLQTSGRTALHLAVCG